MKPGCRIVLCTALFGVIAPTLKAQIVDDDTSATMLAFQCAVSSGQAASGYENYGRKLAKTIALLGPDQQYRIFGYTPQPAASFVGDTWNAPSIANADVTAPAAASPAENVTDNPVVTAIGLLNDALFGISDTSEPIVAGSLLPEEQIEVVEMLPDLGVGSGVDPVELATVAGGSSDPDGSADSIGGSDAESDSPVASSAADALPGGTGDVPLLAGGVIIEGGSEEVGNSESVKEETDSESPDQEEDQKKWWDDILAWLTERYEEYKATDEDRQITGG
ncbi:MAG: hypothetical protein P1U68_13900 [Verrucomicrobiales bacterium]|nr:hypothetical protein [Verrucomicrobiales bacterium]